MNKILHIGQIVGGLGIYIKNSIDYMSNDFEYVIVKGKEEKFKGKFRKSAKIKVYEVDIQRSLNPFLDLKGLFQVYRIVKKENPDLLHCHSAKGGMIGRIVGAMMHIPTLYTPHGFSFLSTSSKLKRFVFLLFERITRFNTKILACSKSECLLAINDVNYKKKNVLFWNNSVPDFYQLEIPTLDIKNPYICCVGRPSYQKNTLLLVEIVKELVKQFSDLKFYLLGVGFYSPELKILKNTIEKYKLQDSFILVEWLSQKEIFSYLKDAKLYLTVSRYEGLPLSVIESMSFGIPIVATDVVGNRDCVENGINGYLHNIDDNKKIFVNSIERILGDEDLRKELGKQSRIKYKTKFEILSQIFKLNAIYKENIINLVP